MGAFFCCDYIEHFLDIVEVGFVPSPVFFVSCFDVPVSPTELIVFARFCCLHSAEGIDLDLNVFFSAMVCAELGYRFNLIQDFT